MSGFPSRRRLTRGLGGGGGRGAAPGVEADPQPGAILSPQGCLELGCLLGGDTGFLSLTFFLLGFIFLERFSGPSEIEWKVQ